MHRPGREAGEAQAFEQVVHAVEAVAHAELLLKDADHIHAPQRADPAVGLGGPGEDALTQRLFLLAWQLGGPTGPGPGGDRVKPAIAVGVAPLLHEVTAASEHRADDRLLPPVQRQPHRAQAIALGGVVLDAEASVQFGQVVRVMGDDVHRPMIAEQTQSRKTEQAPYRACGLSTMRIT